MLAGVYPGQSVAVVLEAATLAKELHRPLLCAYVAIDTYLADWESGDRRNAESLYPGDLGPADDRIALDLAASIAQTLNRMEPLEHGWSLRVLAGDPGHVLKIAADEVAARLIVVGTHGSGAAHVVEAWLSGSVAAHLSRATTRPVVVVPVAHEERGAEKLGRSPV
ncbi:universal stress protein [Leifsonia poae]|uniref:UspA domain-containing protein n=1 Tax=Leifsonia poae TaxID=110933 RepID=A0A9W6HE04_9MICO|nr:universal stress protein [Leifsonia poae]GLJ78038.1 hypothetical protein GCM10017584_36120 [Leifsonia poae]